MAEPKLAALRTAALRETLESAFHKKPPRGLTFEKLMRDVEARGRDLLVRVGSLADANRQAAVEVIARAAKVSEELADRMLGGLYWGDFSGENLEAAREMYADTEGVYPEKHARPVVVRLIEAVMLDLIPDSPAVLADFWITDQDHYEALYYPIRAGEMNSEDLDLALGDSDALTALVARSPSNPHKGIVFGPFEGAGNGGPSRAALSGIYEAQGICGARGVSKLYEAPDEAAARRLFLEEFPDFEVSDIRPLVP